MNDTRLTIGDTDGDHSIVYIDDDGDVAIKNSWNEDDDYYLAFNSKEWRTIVDFVYAQTRGI